MGHMHPRDLCELFVKRIYAQGWTSIDDAREAAQARGIEVSCSEGGYTDDYMYEMAFGFIISYLRGKLGTDPPQEESIIILADDELTAGQGQALSESDLDETEDWDSEEYVNFATIRWKFGLGWRRKYADIPMLAGVTS